MPQEKPGLVYTSINRIPKPNSSNKPLATTDSSLDAAIKTMRRINHIEEGLAQWCDAPQNAEFWVESRWHRLVPLRAATESLGGRGIRKPELGLCAELRLSGRDH